MKLKIECPIRFIDCALDEFILTDQNDADILICHPAATYKYDKNYLSGYKNLKILATPSTGATHIDVDFCKINNIKVLSLLDDRLSLNNIYASAEFTWLHIMNSVRNFYNSINLAKEGNWRNVSDQLRGREMNSLILGIIGFGRIGHKIAKYAGCFGMQYFVHDPYANCFSSDLYNLAKLSDVIVVCPYLTVETKNMINKKFIDHCKDGCIIVNTSRGEVVNEQDICDAVKSGKIKYSTDVVCNEQNLKEYFNSELYELFLKGKICITPHIAGLTIESETKAFNIIISLIKHEFKI